MEVSIRGLLENLIDDLTSEKGLHTAFTVIGEFKPIVKSKQDAVFGYIIGAAFSNFAANYHITQNRLPNTSESEKFRILLLERANIIMSKIQKFSQL